MFKIVGFFNFFVQNYNSLFIHLFFARKNIPQMVWQPFGCALLTGFPVVFSVEVIRNGERRNRAGICMFLHSFPSRTLCVRVWVKLWTRGSAWYILTSALIWNKCNYHAWLSFFLLLKTLVTNLWSCSSGELIQLWMSRY